MPVEIQTITPTRVSLTIEVERDKVKAELEKVFQEMAKQVQIKGFRKGKAPRKMIEKYINQDMMRKEVLERLIPPAYDQALKSNHIIPVTKPEYEVVSYTDNEPLKFKATFEKRPEISLPDYKALEAEVQKREVREEDVEKTVHSLRELRAAFEEWPDGVVTEGHGAVVDFQGFVDGKPFEGGSSQGLLLEIKKDWMIPGFMEQIIGMKAGEEREIRVTIPQSFEPEIAGKEATFKVRVQAVKERKLPEVNDAFAQAVGEYKSLEDLKKGIRDHIGAALENQEKTEALQKVMDRLTDTIDFPVPEVFVEERMKQFERDALQFLAQQRKPFPDFLREKYPEIFKIEGVSEEEKTNRAVSRFREELRPKALKMARVDLILDEIWHRENLRVTQEEVSSEIHRLADHYKMTPESIAKALQEDQTFQSFISGMLRAKASLVIRDNLKISYQSGENKT